MKKLYLIIAALIATNAVIYSIEQPDGQDTVVTVIEETVIEIQPAGCLYGGPGTSSCQISNGVDIGGGISVGCAVTCNEGYYSCCSSAGCRCVPNDSLAQPVNLPVND